MLFLCNIQGCGILKHTFFIIIYISSLNFQGDQAMGEFKKQWGWSQLNSMNMDWPKCVKLSIKCWQKGGTRKLLHHLCQNLYLADNNVIKPKFWRNSSNTEMAHQLLKSSHTVLRFPGGEKVTDSLDFPVKHLLQLRAIRVIRATESQVGSNLWWNV
jgi:hypothetical protein